MDTPKYIPLAEYTFGCFYYNGTTPFNTLDVKGDSLHAANQVARKLLNPTTTQSIRHISTRPNADFVAERERREDVNKQLDALTNAAKERMKACHPGIAGVTGGSEIDFMTTEEKAQRHALLLSLPGGFHAATESAARVAWRIKSRRSREAVRQALEQFGWESHIDPAIAKKTFKTAVGEKVAHVYLNSGDSFNRTLSGDYQSQGRNILESCGVLIPHEVNDELLLFQVSYFVKSVETAIANSYAARLLPV